MHRHVGPSHMLCSPECRCWEACGFRGFRRLGGRRIKHKLVIFMLSASQYPSQFFPSVSHKLPYFPCSCRRERPYRKLGNQNIFFCKITKAKKNPTKAASFSSIYISISSPSPTFCFGESKRFSHLPFYDCGGEAIRGEDSFLRTKGGFALCK